MNKDEQKKLLIEVMEADEKDGLYKTNNMKQQTAVEWLIEMISPYITDEKANPLIEQAKQMEKEQIVKAAIYDPFLGELPRKEGEHYYNETYGE